MDIFHPSEMVAPGGLVLRDEAPQVRLQLLVETLSLTVGASVVTRGHTDRVAEELAELLPEGGDELWSSVGNNVIGKPMDSEDVVHHGLCCLLGRR